MNSCILMAKIVRSPELRYTQDNQTPFAQMLVEFEGTRPEEPPSNLRVVAWGGLGTEVAQAYTEGDRVILEGRLSMNTLERPEGFKEKRAELVVSRIFRLENTTITESQETSKTTDGAVSTRDEEKYQPTTVAGVAPQGYTSFAEPEEEVFTPLTPTGVSEENLDDIPF